MKDYLKHSIMNINDFKHQFPIFAKSIKKMDDLNLKFHIQACIYQEEQLSNQKDVVLFLRHRTEAVKEEIAARAKSRQKKEVIKARLRRMEKKSRDIPKSVMKSVIKEAEDCPYCFEQIENGNVDHIYPLTLGGLNISQNLVYCCNKCNNIKAGMTLNEFIYEYNLDWKRIKQRLKELNKRF